MFQKLRQYRAHGRTAHAHFDHDHDRQHTPRHTELLISAFDDPPEFPSALRLDFGDKDNDGGWIKFPKSSIEKTLSLFHEVDGARINVYRHEGVSIDVQPNSDLQHGVRDVRKVVLKIERIDQKTGSPGCELTLGLHEAAGAEIILTPAQTDDFLTVLDERLTHDLQDLNSYSYPSVVQPDGTTR